MKKIILVFVCLIVFINQTVAQNWTPMLEGVPFSVSTIYGDSIDHLLYTGGGFSLSGSFRVWNGFVWTDLNLPSNAEPISEITRFKDNIYIGGGFNFMDTVLCKGLVKWNGQVWDTVTTQIDDGTLWYGGISGLLSTDSFLYVLGSFDSINHVKSPGIIKYDGANWFAIGDFENSFPGGATADIFSCAAIYNDEIYVGGNYHDSSGHTHRIAKFDGLNWSDVGQGINGPFAGVEDLQVYQSELYVAGTFKKTEGDPGDFIAKWNGTTWSEVGLGMAGLSPTYNNGQVHDLYVYNNELYACGVFHYAGGVPALYVAKWNGSEWCGFGDTLDNVSVSLGSFNDELFMGGGFEVIGTNSIETGDSINHIAKWIGGNYVDTCSIAVSINEVSENDFLFSIFPNPSADQLHLSLKFSQTKEIVATIINLIGEQLLTESLAMTDPVIDISMLSDGIYFLSLQTEKGIVIRKFIKQ